VRTIIPILHFARAELGPELQIVCLDMAEQDQTERVRERHAGDEVMVTFMKVRHKAR
jgi:hypothetical protein